MEKSLRILVAPLHWGLGHATRCIPIIKALQKHGYTPVIASDGAALELLQKEFKELEWIELPSYNVRYSRTSSGFLWALLLQFPHIYYTVTKEHRILKKIIKEKNIDGIISDNRLGIYSKKIPSVIISHQLQVLSGKFTRISTLAHQYFIKKFAECWVPDSSGLENLSGRLGHLKKAPFPLQYMGVLSRFSPQKMPKKYDIMVLLSGPEPQRTLLEQKLIEVLKNYPAKVLFVKGVVEPIQTQVVEGSFVFYNYMTSIQLEESINQSELIISRSGYTTVMDLAVLHKKALFIPTPGQYEQEYLAKRLHRKGIVPMVSQDMLSLKDLHQVTFYKGFENRKFEQPDWDQLFSIFKNKTKS